MNNDQGGSIELGDSGRTGATPYIDFHYGMSNNQQQDYNVRLINSGDGKLTLAGGNFVIGGAGKGLILRSLDGNDCELVFAKDTGGIGSNTLPCP